MPDVDSVVRALTLEPIEGGPIDRFHIVDPSGTRVGSVEAYQHPNKMVEIANIDTTLPPKGGNTILNTNSQALGTSNIRSLLNALREYYGDATGVFGNRVSGARYLSPDMGNKGYASVKFPTPPPVGVLAPKEPGAGPGMPNYGGGNLLTKVF